MRECDTADVPIRTEECVTNNSQQHNVDQTFYNSDHEEREAVIYDQVLYINQRQANDPIRMEACPAYAPSQLLAGQQPVSDHILMEECPAYAPSQVTSVR